MSESRELNGEIKVIYDTLTFDSGFSKREFVVTVEDGKFPQDIKLELLKDKTTLLDQFAVGQNVTVKFDLRGNEHKGKYYTNLVAWFIESDDIPQDEPAPAQSQDDAGADEPNDDIPL